MTKHNKGNKMPIIHYNEFAILFRCSTSACGHCQVRECTADKSLVDCKACMRTNRFRNDAFARDAEALKRGASEVER